MNEFQNYFYSNSNTDSDSRGIQLIDTGANYHESIASYPDSNHPKKEVLDWKQGSVAKEYRLIYIAEGEGVFETEGLSPFPVRKGCVILIYPNKWHRYKPNQETGWQEYWVCFSGDYAQFLLENQYFSIDKPVLNLGYNVELIQSFEKLYALLEDKNIDFKNYASFVLIHILSIIYFNVLTGEHSIGRKGRLIDSVANEITANWIKKIDFEEIAKKHHISYSLLRKEFKAHTRTTLKQFHLNIKLRKAEQMILETDYNLSEIAYQCGFENIQLFSKMFKSKMGVNPSKLRNKPRS